MIDSLHVVLLFNVPINRLSEEIVVQRQRHLGTFPRRLGPGLNARFLEETLGKLLRYSPPDDIIGFINSRQNVCQFLLTLRPFLRKILSPGDAYCALFHAVTLMMTALSLSSIQKHMSYFLPRTIKMRAFTSESITRRNTFLKN